MTEASAPRPSVVSGFVPTFERALRGALRGKKVLGLLFVLALPPLLHLLIPDRVNPHRMFEVVSMVVLFLYLQGLVPLTGLAFGTSILLDEAGGGTLPYLFTRPVPRGSIVAGKFAAATLLACLGIAISLGVTLVTLREATMPEGYVGRVLLAGVLAVPAYLALFAFLSSISKWGVLVGLLWVFGVETALSLIPGMVRKMTLVFYSRSLLGEWKSHELRTRDILGPDGGASMAMSIQVLVLTTGIALTAAILITTRKQHVGAGRD